MIGRKVNSGGSGTGTRCVGVVRKTTGALKRRRKRKGTQARIRKGKKQPGILPEERKVENP